MNMPPWTYSQLESFESCPRKFYHLKVARDVVEPPTIHTQWGTEVHTAMENRILHGTPLPEGMTQWEPIASKIQALPGIKLTEEKFAIDRNFQPTDWSTAWSRGIADLTVLNRRVGAVADYKTGKRKPTEQLDLYAAYVFAYHPQIEKVNTAFIWLKEKKTDTNTIRRDELPALWRSFLPRTIRLEDAYQRDKWPAKPSGLCNGWCPCTGCEYNKRK